jgi:plastocyanin
MVGNDRGSKVWFQPAGLLVRPGETVRWVNRDRGNAHTATAFHPANDGHPLRIPAGAEPWDSGYLLPDEAFELTLRLPGVYDYFCIPHEAAGMVGRIVVASPPGGTSQKAADGVPIPGLDRDPFPAVEAILRDGRVPPD